MHLSPFNTNAYIVSAMDPFRLYSIIRNYYYNYYSMVQSPS
jgi:hypothetical protein